MIVARQLASYLALPMFLVDPAGDLMYYNEPAEEILGVRYEETGSLTAEHWAAIFSPMNESGETISSEQLPLNIALTKRQPAHNTFWIRGADRRARHISVTAIPVIGQSDRFLGAITIFWQVGA
ncbi:MAG: PAS domain-containing protein [Chloroflexi bacterium]|nr:PAS domain-containing protein [Chloroflexota bacterium]